MSRRDDPLCPICFDVRHLGKDGQPPDIPLRLDCPTCGKHILTDEAAHELAERLIRPKDRARLAYGVAHLRPNATITVKLIEDLLKNQRLPDPFGMIDELVLWLADCGGPGSSRRCWPEDIQAIVGAEDQAGAVWTREEAILLGYIEWIGDGSHDPDDCGLTAKGWARHAELLRNGAGSRNAFMAMAFGEPDIGDLYTKHLCKAVEETGFVLRTTEGDHKTAGSIDNRMRVEIRTARFVICDLSHGNRGAYWEAGFAEGLGRPVFYTCRRDVLESKDHPDAPHFDTRQQLIIRWDPDNPDPAMKELKDTIRATLPAEAKMEDDPAK